VIEVDGDYWHSLPSSRRNDKAKNTYLRNHGYKLLRIRGSQVHAGEALTLLDVTLNS
jgi:very-short-patch-repair endonuclease